MFRRKLLAAVTVGVIGVFAIPTAARADSTVSINPGNVPTTAEAAGDHECGPALGGGPYAGKDVWVFNLPGKDAGDFVTVTATFSKPGGGTATIVIDAGAADGDDIVRQGTSKAWVVTPDGWTLTGATAVVTGQASFFVLTHTCPSNGSGGGSGGTPPPTEGTPAPPTTAATTGAPGGGPGSTPPGGLPVTGSSVTGVFLTGAALVLIGGTALFLVRRRRGDETFEA